MRIRRQDAVAQFTSNDSLMAGISSTPMSLDGRLLSVAAPKSATDPKTASATVRFVAVNMRFALFLFESRQQLACVGITFHSSQS